MMGRPLLKGPTARRQVVNVGRSMRKKKHSFAGNVLMKRIARWNEETSKSFKRLRNDLGETITK